MRLLVILVAVAATLWSGWWVVGSRGTQAALERGRAAAEAQGWTVAWSRAATRGFPNRFDTTVEDLRVATPDGALAWTAPVVQALMLSYRPNHVIVAFPPSQVVEVGGLPVTIRAERLRASLVVEPSLDAGLERATLEGDALSVTAPPGTVATRRAQLAMRAAGRSSYDVALDLLEVAPPGALAARFGDLPATVEEVHADLTLTLSAPLDRRAGEASPVPEAAAIRRAGIVWGPLVAWVSGEVAWDAAGLAQGDLVVTLRGWERALDLLAEAGVVPANRRALVEAALRGMAGRGEGGGGAEEVEIPLALRDGALSFGPLTLARLPALGR